MNNAPELVAAVFSAAAFAISLYVLVRYRPDQVLRELSEIRDEIPTARQHLAAWTIETENMLERCEIKLKTAHQRRGGRPPKQQPQEEEAPAPMDRRAQLALVQQQLMQRGA